MRDKTMDQRTAAEKIIRNLKAEVEQLRSDKTDAIAEQWVETTDGRCRVAVCSSAYGVHFEIGPLYGSETQSTKVLPGSDQAHAVDLLAQLL